MICTASTSWLRGERAERALPAAAGEVADHGDEPTLAGQPGDPADGRAEIGVAEALDLGGGGDRLQHGSHLVAPGAGRHQP